MRPRYKVYAVGDDIINIPSFPGDPVVEEGLSILRKLNRVYLVNIFSEEAPLIVRDEGSGNYVASLLWKEVIEERKSDESIYWILKGFSTMADALVYLMDASMGTNLPEELESIYFWLHERILERPVTGQRVKVEMEPRLMGRLNFVRRKVLAYQLIYLKKKGLV